MRRLCLVIATVAAAATLSGCLAGAAIGAAGAVVGTTAKVAVKTTGAVVGAVLPDNEKKDKERQPD